MRNFQRAFVITALLVTLPLPVLTTALDPHWLFGNSTKFSARKYPYDERAQKTNLALNSGIVFDSLIIGSSRASYINHQDFQSGTFFNYSVPGIYPREYIKYIDVAKTGRNLKRMVLGMDFYGTNKNHPDSFYHPQPNEYIVAASTWRGRLKQLMSVDSLKYIQMNYACSMSDACGHDYYDRNFSKHMYMPDEGGRNEQILTSLQAFETYHYGPNYRWNEEVPALYHAINEDNRNSKISVFVAPISRPLFSLLVKDGLLEVYANWLRVIVREFGHVYDFSGINSVTGDLSNYRDTDHFSPAVGKWIANRIEGRIEDVPVDFGVLVTAQNIEQHISDLRRQALLADPDPIETARRNVADAQVHKTTE